MPGRNVSSESPNLSLGPNLTTRKYKHPGGRWGRGEVGEGGGGGKGGRGEGGGGREGGGGDSTYK